MCLQSEVIAIPVAAAPHECLPRSDDAPCEAECPDCPTSAEEREGQATAEDLEENELFDELEVPDTSSTNAQGDFRAKFLHKLAARKVYVPPVSRPPSHQTVIIFDWDDTLLCTSWLQRNDSPSAAKDKIIADIAETSARLLESAMAFGQTFIVTNAQDGWVEHSAEKWAPALLPVLRKLKVISARSQNEAAFPEDVAMWKIRTFSNIRKEYDSAILTNLLALGDASYEMTAALSMAAEFETAMVKTIKFKEHPTPAEHLKQLQLVADKIESIVAAPRKMRIFLEKR